MNNKKKNQNKPEKSLRTNRFRFRKECVLVLIMVAAMITGNIPLAGQQVRIAQHVSFDELRNEKFCEILVVKEGSVDVYNTALNECRADLWDRLNLEQIKQQFGARAVQKNGPYFWMMDSQSIALKEKVSIGPMRARWAATLDSAVLAKTGNGIEPYKVFTVMKTQDLEKMVYFRQKPVYELIDPNGHIYVLTARHEKVPVESLGTLNERMRMLPDGWQYRARILTENMVLEVGKDTAKHVVGDEFQQYYARISETR